MYFTDIYEKVVPNKLLESLHDSEVEIGTGIRILSLIYDDTLENLEIIFGIDLGESKEIEKWKLTVFDRQYERISQDWAENISVYDDHYLLWEFNDQYNSLYFKEKARNPDAMIADFISKYQAEFGEWVPIDTYINSMTTNYMNVLELAHQKHGMFASGPQKFLKQFQLWLEPHGIEPYFVSYKENTEKQNNFQLLILGVSYFIGRRFEFTLL